VIGSAVVAAAMEWTAGGYTVIVDGTVFPDSAQELARAFHQRDVPVHYVILCCDLSTCVNRAMERDGDVSDRSRFEALHARFSSIGAHGKHVIEASDSANDVASAVLAEFRSGGLAVA
jgi:predicted kinase